jgi:DNA integrity scanning protein DisA with diadenylate cyclase activity
MPEDAGLLDRTVAHLAEDRQVDPDLLNRLLRCAFRMSEENLGAIFMVGDSERILEKSDAPELSHFAWISSAPLANLTDEELITFAQQDGATVIDAVSGRFRSCMVLLRPDAGTRAEVGPGKGARHSSAAKMSAEASALAITVSQDGPITVYDRGRRVLGI